MNYYVLLIRLPNWLGGRIRDIRWWKLTVISTIMWAFGWWLVYLWASHLDQDAVAGRQVVSIVMVPGTYLVHRYLIWEDRNCRPVRLKLRWSWTWVKLHFLNTAIYWLAVSAAGLPYLEVGMAMTIPMALLGYHYRDRKDFAEDFVSQTPVAEVRAQIEAVREPRML
jgi:hypothetical protein